MEIKRSALVQNSVEQMYSLVEQVEKYPEFIPEISQVDDVSRQPGSISARLHIQKGPVHYAFATTNQCQPPLYMSMELLEGPFKYLKGEWHFHKLAEDACKVEFQLEFEAKNKLISLALNPLISQLADQMVQRFCERAKHVYS